MPFTTINSTFPLQTPPGLSSDKPVRMLNLLKFRPQAAYDSQTDLPPCTGQEAYFTRYVPAFTTIAESKGGAQVVFLSTSLMNLVGPTEEQWDVMVLVEYPSIRHFEDIVGCEDYKRMAEHHRLAGLEDWRLIAGGG